MATAVLVPDKGWTMTDDNSEGTESIVNRLLTAIEENDAVSACELIVNGEFTLFELIDEDDEEGQATMTADVEDYQALVAFTNEELAAEFAGAMPDFFSDEEEVPAFLIDGGSLLNQLPEGFGILLNPETEETVILPPDFIERIRLQLDPEDLEDSDE